MDKAVLNEKILKVRQENPQLTDSITRIVNAFKANTALNQDFDVLSECLDALSDVSVETLVNILDAFGRLKADVNGQIGPEQLLRMFRDTINLKRSTTGDIMTVKVLNVTAPRHFTAKEGKNKGQEGTIMNIMFYSGGQVIGMVTSEEGWIQKLQTAEIGKSYNLPIGTYSNGKYFFSGDPELKEVANSVSDTDVVSLIKGQYPPLTLDMDLSPFIGSKQSYWLSGYIISPRKTQNGWRFNLTDENKKTDVPVDNAPAFWFNSIMDIHDMDRALIVSKVVQAKDGGPSMSVEFVVVLNTLHKPAIRPNEKPVQSRVPSNMDPSGAFNTPSPSPQPAVASPPPPPPPQVQKNETAPEFGV